MCKRFHRFSLALEAVAACCVLSLALQAGPPPSNGAGRKLDHRTSWVGNTFGQGGEAWVQNWVIDIAVSPDGSVYTNTEWDEAGRDAGVYLDGKCLASEPNKARRGKRDGGRPVLSLNAAEAEAQHQLEPADPVRPERLFDRNWALGAPAFSAAALKVRPRSVRVLFPASVGMHFAHPERRAVVRLGGR